MTLITSFKIPGRPVATPRPRVSRRGAYMPKKYTQAMNDALVHARGAIRFPVPLVGGVLVICHFYHPRPQRLKKKSSPRGAVPRLVRPDIDNQAKFALDLIVKAGILQDDNQVAGLFCLDMFVRWDPKTGADRPRTEITIHQFGAVDEA